MKEQKSEVRGERSTARARAHTHTHTHTHTRTYAHARAQGGAAEARFAALMVEDRTMTTMSYAEWWQARACKHTHTHTRARARAHTHTHSRVRARASFASRAPVSMRPGPARAWMPMSEHEVCLRDLVGGCGAVGVGGSLDAGSCPSRFSLSDSDPRPPAIFF